MKKTLCIGLCFLLILMCTLTSCNMNESGTEAESAANSDLKECAAAIRTDTDLEYAILSTFYYYNEDGSVMKIKQSAEYEDESKAKTDYATMEVMSSYFSEYSLDGLVLSCTVAESAYDEVFPDRDYDSVIKNAEENGLTYEILK